MKKSIISNNLFTIHLANDSELTFKAIITVTIALIIEASIESYFQFWLQSSYSLPDILVIFANFDSLGQLLTLRTISIVLSFITITVSIIKISNKDKNEALTPLVIIVMIMKILLDLVSRVLIFFIFMIVDNDGKFSPMRTLTSFYTMVGIMIIFNMVFNERRNFGSVTYWLGESSFL